MEKIILAALLAILTTPCLATTETENAGLKGKVREWVQKYYETDGSLSYKTVYIYDTRGNRIEDASYNADGTLKYFKTIHTYNERGNKTQEARYRGDGSLWDTVVYTYDSRGKKLEETHRKADGTLLAKSVYTYDSHGNMVEAKRYNTNGSFQGKTVYTYDERGNITEEIRYETNTVSGNNELVPASISRYTYAYHE